LLEECKPSFQQSKKELRHWIAPSVVILNKKKDFRGFLDRLSSRCAAGFLFCGGATIEA
jgi:hypothetical protein